MTKRPGNSWPSQVKLTLMLAGRPSPCTGEKLSPLKRQRVGGRQIASIAEHLFLSLADNSSHTSKPSQMPPCLFSENVRGNHPAPSDPSPAAEACHLHSSLTLDLPTSHSLPTYLPTHTWIDLLTKPPAYHFHPTFTLTCTTLIQAFFKSSKIMSSEKRKK